MSPSPIGRGFQKGCEPGSYTGGKLCKGAARLTGRPQQKANTVQFKIQAWANQISPGDAAGRGQDCKATTASARSQRLVHNCGSRNDPSLADVKCRQHRLQ